MATLLFPVVCQCRIYVWTLSLTLARLDLLDRLERIAEDEWESSEIKWHKNCHASFTSATNMSRVENRYKKYMQEMSQAPVETAGCSTSSSRRASRCPVNWEKCIFCQKEESKSVVHNIETLEKSRSIISLSETDPLMRVRLSGMNDFSGQVCMFECACEATDCANPAGLEDVVVDVFQSAMA